MDDLAIPVCNDVKKPEVKRYAKSKYVTCSLALAAVMSLCTWYIFQNGDDHSLKSFGERSVAEKYPRLIIHPSPLNDTDRTLIWFLPYAPNSYKVWVDELRRFIGVYRHRDLYNVCHCDFDNPPPGNKVCNVEIELLSRMADENFYYDKAAPWIILNLSDLNGWKPDFYNETNKLPNEMPADLKYLIQDLSIRSVKSLNMVWVSCEGVNATDTENIGPVYYYPTRGFPEYFYPYENIEGYLGPLVAVKFERPATGVLINIKCKAWAKNLHNGENQVGTSHFELKID